MTSLTLAKVNTTSPYAVAIRVKDPISNRYEDKPLRKSGNFFRVDLQEGDLVEVVAFNDTDYEHVVKVYLDGLSRFALANDASDRDNVDLVMPRSGRIVKGYYRDGNKVDSFLVGSFADSLVKELMPSSPSVGTITVTFHAAWQVGSSPPPGEESAWAGLGFKPGPPRDDPTETVTREVGIARTKIAILYDN